MTPANNPKISLGKLGEEIASDFLKNKGYKIIERNFRTRFGELDIIAKDGNCLVFIEVKTRKNLFFGLGRESITLSKQNKIRHTALFYLQKRKIGYTKIRFDVVEILLSKNNAKITLIREAF